MDKPHPDPQHQHDHRHFSVLTNVVTSGSATPTTSYGSADPPTEGLQDAHTFVHAVASRLGAPAKPSRLSRTWSRSTERLVYAAPQDESAVADDDAGPWNDDGLWPRWPLSASGTERRRDSLEHVLEEEDEEEQYAAANNAEALPYGVRKMEAMASRWNRRGLTFVYLTLVE